MRFQCLDVTCGKEFGWTAKKIVKLDNVTTIEYVICPYCGSLNFDEIPFSLTKPKAKPFTKSPHLTNMEPEKDQFDPADLIDHKEWKNRKQGENNYSKGSLEWGWDFQSNFKSETLRALEQSGGAIELDNYRFELEGKLVKTKKVKK